MSYTVTAPLVIVRDKAGASHHFYEGGVIASTGYDADHVTQLLEGGLIAKVEDAPAADAEPKPAKVEDILAEVGDDKDKAAEALATEQARGDAARSTLVAKLQAVVDAS